MPRYCVLQVEDDENDVVFMRFAWQRAELAHLLRAVSSGEEALAYFKGEGPYGKREEFPLPALVLLDIKMPRLDGFEVLQWIRSEPGLCGTVVVMLTASAQPADVERAWRLGANAFVQKPARNDALGRLVRDLVQFWFEHHEFPPNIPEVLGVGEGRGVKG